MQSPRCEKAHILNEIVNKNAVWEKHKTKHQAVLENIAVQRKALDQQEEEQKTMLKGGQEAHSQHIKELEDLLAQTEETPPPVEMDTSEDKVAELQLLV